MAVPGVIRMRAAAVIVARRAQLLAGAWSVKIPPSIKVSVKASSAEISSQVGPSYPNEVEGVRHPVFGPTAKNPDPPWVTNEHRPFLEPAAEQTADAVAAEVGRSIDDLCHDLGFEGTG